MTKLKQLEEAMKNVDRRRDALINKYQVQIESKEVYISSILASKYEKQLIRKQINCYREFLTDLKFL